MSEAMPASQISERMIGVRDVVILLCLCCLRIGLSDLIIYNATQYIYEQSSSLTVYGTGLISIVNNSIFVLGSEHQALQQNLDYRIKGTSVQWIVFNGKHVQMECVVLERENRSWLDNATRDPPVFLTLSSISLIENPSQNLLSFPVNIARVLPTPSVEFDQTDIEPTTEYLYIRGSNLIGCYYVLLSFDPNYFLYYTDVSSYPLTENLLVLQLSPGHRWRFAAGRLSVLSINTGAGQFTLNGAVGIQIANVGDGVGQPSLRPTAVPTSASPTQTGVAVLPNVIVYPSDQKVYSASQWSMDSTIYIYGENFNTSWTISDLLFNVVMQNVEMTFASTGQIELRPHMQWTTMGELILFGLKIDGKFLPVNLKVATIYAIPSFEWREDYLSLSQSHLLTIHGSNFFELESVQVELNPTSSDAFVVQSVTSNTITLRLLPDQKWLPDNGQDWFPGLPRTMVSLQLTGVNFGIGWLRSGWLFVGNVVVDFGGITCDDSCELAYNGVCDDITVDQSNLEQLRFNGSEFCPASTDCTDCGGVRAILAAPYPNEPESEGCTNTCYWAFDGWCDVGWCGDTDCHDCAPYLDRDSMLVLAGCIGARNNYLTNRTIATESSTDIEMTEYSELSQSDYDLEVALQQSRNEFEQVEVAPAAIGFNMPPVGVEHEEDMVQVYALEEDSQLLQEDRHALPELVPVECELDENRPPQADCEVADLPQITTAVVHVEVEAHDCDRKTPINN